MMDRLLEKHNSQQHLLDQHCRMLERCTKSMQSTRDQARSRTGRFLRHQRLHGTCRGEEATLAEDEARCTRLRASQEEVGHAVCEALEAFKVAQGKDAAHKAAASRHPGEDVKTYLERLSGKYCGDGDHNSGLIQKLVRHRHACQSATADAQSTSVRCNATAAVRNATRQRCGLIQDSMGKTACESAVIQRQACSTYQGCAEKAITTYNLMKATAQKQEAARKDEWRAHLRMRCVLEMLESGKEHDKPLDECEEAAKKAKAEHLTLKYTCNTERTPCSVTTLYPGSSTYNDLFQGMPTTTPAKAIETCKGMGSYHRQEAIARARQLGKQHMSRQRAFENRAERRAQRHIRQRAQRCARRTTLMGRFPPSGRCTCSMSVQDSIDYIYVDGEVITSKLNRGCTHTISFGCGPSTVLAIQGFAIGNSDSSNIGCSAGGLALTCNSTYQKSAWHGLVADTTWKAFGAPCVGGPCQRSHSHKNTISGAPAGWFLPTFDDSTWQYAGDANSMQSPGAAPNIGGSTGGVCSPKGPGWLFRSYMPCDLMKRVH